MATRRKKNRCQGCGNDLFTAEVDDTEQTVWHCTNCKTTQPRKVYKRGSCITPSQQNVIDNIRQYYLDALLYKRIDNPDYQPELSKFKVEVRRGKVDVKAESEVHPLVGRSGGFVIGRRGGVTCYSAFQGMSLVSDMGCKQIEREVSGYYVSRAERKKEYETARKYLKKMGEL